MLDPIPLLGVLGWIAFIVLSLVGFRDFQTKQEGAVLLGATFAAAMVAASKGFMICCVYFFLFPMGLVFLLMGEREDPELVMGILVGAYVLYIALSVVCLVTKTVTARICWAVLVAVLLTNIGGCHLMIEDTLRNLSSERPAYSYAAKRLAASASSARKSLTGSATWNSNGLTR